MIQADRIVPVPPTKNKRRRLINYDGWCAAEILPISAPDAAAKQAAEYLLPYFQCIQ